MSKKSSLASLNELTTKIEKEILNLQGDLSKKSAQLKDIKNRIEQIKNKRITFTDHAMVRFFERIQDFNIAKIKKDILTDEVVNTIMTLNSGSFPVEHKVYGKFILKVKDKVIITIVKE